MILLRHGDYELALAPQAGGSIAAFRFCGQDVMRPATEEAIAARDPLGMASFPLVPYSNRIAHGRFRFGSHEVQLPLNFGDHPHAIHGHGWQVPWSVLNATDLGATLIYDHAADAWPWAYRATQTFVLGNEGLDLLLSVENRAADPMPAGLGIHPYYPKTPAMRLNARLDGWWETDEHVMPIAYHGVAPTEDWSSWLHAERTTDNVFSGWNGRARIFWPDRGLALGMTASDNARYMVVYAPAGGDICCIEPVTHPTDALNQPDRPDIAVLEPGQRALLRVRLSVEAA